MRNKKILISCILVAIIAIYGQRLGWLIYSTFIIAFPQYLVDPFAEVCQSQSLSYDCSIPHHNISQFFGVTTFEQLIDIVEAQGHFSQKPLLFKQFISDPNQITKEVLELHGNDNITFTNVSIESFGNTWLNGVR
jgi:hypothetical protein